MPPDRPQFGGGPTTTMLHPAVAVAVLLAIALMYFLPRRYLVVPLLACVFLTPRGQQVVLGGVHLFVLRILIIFGWGRLLLLKTTSLHKISWTSVDSAFLAWVVCHASAVILLNRNAGAVNNQAGFLLDALGGYYLLRNLITNDRDIVRTIRTLGVLAGILGACMAYEHFCGLNVFGLLGGVEIAPGLRNGSLRAQAVFAHPLLAGSFGATLIPLLIWLWKSGKGKTLALFGLVGAGAMVAATASSTPLLTSFGGIVALSLWPVRNRMRQLRWAIALTALALQCVMKAPVWFLIARIDLTGGSSSYDRAVLVDNCIRHFRDWWLVGIASTAEFGYDMWDLCNQYVAEAETGGLMTLLFFLLIISRCFGRLGRSRKADRGSRREWFLWCLGAALFTHVVGFFGISYFDQTQIAWYALLAVIVAATPERSVGRSSAPSDAYAAHAAPDEVLGFVGSLRSEDAAGPGSIVCIQRDWATRASR